MIVFFLICLFATALGSISGIGGGVIIKPVFDAVSGLSVTTVSFLSGCTVLAMSITSLLHSHKEQSKFGGKSSTALAIGAAIGGIVGKVVFDGVKSASGNDRLLGILQSSFMILLTVGVILYVFNKKHIVPFQISNLIACLSVGAVLGVTSAFLGIGGGPINLAVLYFFFSMDTKQAALNSIYIILFSQSANLIFTVISGSVPEFETAVLLVMIFGGIVGGLCGRMLNKKMSNRQVDRLFLGMLVAITVVSVFNLYKYITL